MRGAACCPPHWTTCKFLLRCGGLVGAPYLTFEWLLGWIFYPLAFVMGVPCGKTRDKMLQKVTMIVFRAQKLTFISQQCRPASGLCLGWCGWPWVWWGQACRCPGQDHFSSVFVLLVFVIVVVLLWLIMSVKRGDLSLFWWRWCWCWLKKTSTE